MNIDEVTRWLTSVELKPEDISKLPQLLLACTAHEIAHQNLAPAENAKPEEPDEDSVGKAEAARLLGVDPSWFRGRRLPFKRRLGHRTVTFSRKGLIKWREAQVNKR